MHNDRYTSLQNVIDTSISSFLFNHQQLPCVSCSHRVRVQYLISSFFVASLCYVWNINMSSLRQKDFAAHPTAQLYAAEQSKFPFNVSFSCLVRFASALNCFLQSVKVWHFWVYCVPTTVTNVVDGTRNNDNQRAISSAAETGYIRWPQSSDAGTTRTEQTIVGHVFLRVWRAPCQLHCQQDGPPAGWWHHHWCWHT